MYRTVEQWFTTQDLPAELAKVLTPGPWKHKRKTISHGQGLMNTYECVKCGFAFAPGVDGGSWEEGPDCSVPDPFDINDWSTAMEWFRKQDRSWSWDAMWKIFKVSDYARAISMSAWLLHIAQPKDLLIATAMVVERKEE